MRWASSMMLVMLALSGCEEETIRVGRGVGPVAPATPGEGVASGGADAGVDGGRQRPEYRDEDFVEADSNRDPFRNYTARGAADAGRPVTSIPVKMSETSVNEMRLIGVVSGMADPRAMIIDRDGVGHVVRRGEFIGRPEVVQMSGTDQTPIVLHWRVDRIRPSEIVLTREDPNAPNSPPLTRVLPLREEGEEAGVRRR